VDRALVERAMRGDEEACTGLMAIAGDRLLAIVRIEPCASHE
jgi:hypothetical protein